MVHIASGYAKQRNRLATFACTSSIGPGATNMVTGAATATVNRLPVLLLPGDIFASRVAPPVLQQQEPATGPDTSANDAFRPVSRYFDRINRADQLPGSLLEAMRVLTDPAETGAVTLALPQDVQTEAFDYPDELFERRVWHVARPVPEPAALARALEVLRRRPPAADRGRRRGHLRRGHRGPGRPGRGDRHPGGRDLRRQGLDAVRPPLGPGGHRRHRDRRGQRHGPRGRRGARDRHPLGRLRHRLAQHLHQPRGPLRQRQRRPGGRVQARRHPGGGRRPPGPGGPDRGPGRLDGRRGLAARGGRAQPRMGRQGRARLPGRPRPPAQPGRGHRGRQRRRRAEGRGRLRRRQHARRPAQAVADPRPQAVPPGVRQLLHGLRDPRGHRHPAGRPRPRGVRHGRRRRLPDEPGRAGHGRGRAGQDHRRPGPEPRLRLDRVAVGGVRQRPLRDQVPLPRGRRRQTARSCPSTWPPTRPASGPRS